MSNLTPYHQRPSIRRAEARQLARTLGSLEAAVRLETAHIDAAAEVQGRRAHAIGRVARAGMHEVAIVSKVETCLATLVPLASGRLAAIGDIAALAVAEVVSDTQRQL
ncbi:MAG TPA: hypothetical protein VK988_18555 [Acidimicrobiales bacterium]|nr:hypothetical protein [Acidimicrobiales bacterium]